MKIFGGLKNCECECGCDITKKPSEGGPLQGGREDLASGGQCCAGELDDCCTEEEDEPTKCH